MISNAYSVEFGGLGGAQINETTRSGGNKFHGNAVYWWNGRAMNANRYFQQAEPITIKPRRFDNVNQWAAAIGGPIYKDHSFFFFNYEGLRVVLPPAASPAFPTPPTRRAYSARTACATTQRAAFLQMGTATNARFYKTALRRLQQRQGCATAAGPSREPR